MSGVGRFFRGFSDPVCWWVMAALFLLQSLAYVVFRAGDLWQVCFVLALISLATAGILTAIRKGGE